MRVTVRTTTTTSLQIWFHLRINILEEICVQLSFDSSEKFLEASQALCHKILLILIGKIAF